MADPTNVTELDALAPIPENARLSNGTMIVYEELRSRQLFALLRIITHGAAPILASDAFRTLRLEGDASEVGAKLLVMVLMAIPEAEDEAIDFIRSMVKPYGLTDKPESQKNKQEKERDASLLDKLDRELDNPEPEDVVTIISDVIRRESADLAALGKRIGGMLKMARQTGQLPQAIDDLLSSAPNSSVASPEPSTSSAAPTGGPTIQSVNSL